MERINGHVVDVGKGRVTVKLYGCIDNRKALLAVFLLGLGQLHALRHGPEPVVVEEVQVVAPQRPLGPPSGRAPRVPTLLVLPVPVAQKTWVRRCMTLLAWKGTKI